MILVTLYTIQSQRVGLADGFTASRQPGGVGPVHALGGGDVLVGIRQQPMGAVWRCGDGEYIALTPELRARLEAPLLAEFKLELDHQRETMWRHFTDAPLWLRIWRALTCR